MFRFSRSGKGEVDVYRFMSNRVQIIICFFVTCLAISCKSFFKTFWPPGTPSKLIQIPGDGNCLFQALSYAVTGRQIYYTRVRAQIMKHMNGSLDSYLVSGQRARNKVRVRGIQLFSLIN